ncbi:ly6/PLAUR domain-containing protein 6 [Corvus cornix cornix]|nr:ly6/PLAUR domain-containing protein 6 [Corvus cornix cornix]XP_010405493.1 ly6/PLAUR domain-containing protein 6 [Corvus cornix cornix]XP_010405494.1 ly6/PLAUR domain-containing protein 6 [Corvus cornix cornix]XP_019146044.1 ly6/PLAUR domain-containing protein 6 [Corvus cornix cornix]XP_039410766.1 ly6/PLAUR domain-containing protein 6 [Corvus cornix cornix]
MAWPPGLLLLLLLLSGRAPAARSRDFTAKDIVYLHPSTTPYPRGFKCFTCEKASDNYECNRWAPDVYCPRGTRYCFSQHMMKASGESVSVTKRCVPLEECLSTGCTYIKHEEYKVCTSCCEGSICNLPLPRNASDAVFATLAPLSGTPRPAPPGLGTPLGLSLALLAQRCLSATAQGQ